MKRRLIVAAALACGLIAQNSFADIPYVDITGKVTVNGVPTEGVLVEAISCDGATVPPDWPSPGPTTTSTASHPGDNYLVVFVTGYGSGATPGPAGSFTFASPANGAWYTAIDVQLKFSYPGYEPVLITCEQIRKAYEATLGNPDPGVAHLNVDINHPLSSPLVPGDTAGIGFWANKNGQALIRSLNRELSLRNPISGLLPTNLGSWLAVNFPHLYGKNSGRNLAGQPNEVVALLYLKLFGLKGSKVDAQMMATAFSVYVTDSDLAGTAAVRYGFNVSTTGTAEKSYNVGANGTAIGLANNTSYSVMALLQQANLQKQLGKFDTKAFNAVFGGLNEQGE